MANEFAQNVNDYSLNPATFALPTQVGEANGKASAAVDLGADTFKAGSYEVSLLVPTLSDTIAPAGSTAGAYYEVQLSSSSTFNTIDRTMRKNMVGTGSGVAQTEVRFRLPSDSPRYVRGKVWLGTTCTDASAVAATFSLKF